MPLVRLDLLSGRTPEQVRQIADAIHDAIVDVLEIPERDRFQVISQKRPDEIIAEDAGLGFVRSRDVLVIQIFTQRGRDTETKQRLFGTIAVGLERLGIAGEDIFIGYVENGPQDWSFGYGRAQYVTGELGVPGVRAVAAAAL